MCTTRGLIVLSIFFALLTGGFLALGFFVPELIHNVLIDGLKDQRVITGFNSTGFPQWNSSDYDGAPLQYFSVFIWNVTNPEDVRNGGRPKLNQTGPWVYTYHYHMFDTTWSDDLNFIKTAKFEQYVPVPDKSVSDPKTTLVTVINVPFTAVRAGLPESDQWWSAMVFDLVAGAANVDIFTTTSAHSAIWGENSTILQFLNDTGLQNTNPWFSLQFNDTTEEECRIRLNYTQDIYNTGNTNFSEVGQYVQWHNLTDLQVWNGTFPNRVTGTDGSTFPAEMVNGTNYTVFVDTLYRHVEFWANMTVDIKGVPARRYWLDPQSFFNHSQGNYGYNLYGPEGLTNMTEPELAQQGSPVPIMLCLPLFFQSDDSYRDNIEFLPPNNIPNHDQHNTELDVEPISGITIAAKKRIQVNVEVSPTFMLYPNLRSVVFPIVWFQLESELTEELADEWKSQVGLALFLIAYGGLIVFGIAGFFGCLFLLSASCAYFRRDRGRDGYDPAVSDDDGIYSPTLIN